MHSNACQILYKGSNCLELEFILAELKESVCVCVCVCVCMHVCIHACVCVCVCVCV